MATQDVEAKELALVGKVEMRIALASSEKKLEDLLKLYLAPLLLKLGSNHGAVRNKVGNLTSIKHSVIHPRTLLMMVFLSQVISICQHINTRIKSQYATSSLYMGLTN